MVPAQDPAKEAGIVMPVPEAVPDVVPDGDRERSRPKSAQPPRPSRSTATRAPQATTAVRPCPERGERASATVGPGGMVSGPMVEAGEPPGGRTEAGKSPGG